MPTIVQFRRGTTAQNNSFTGAVGELSIDTDLDTIRVHDGATAGGFALIQANATQTLTNKTVSGVSATMTANITGGNLLTGGLISATGNITGGNLITSGSHNTTGNLSAGNISTPGQISATGNITGGNLSGTSIVGTLTTAAQPNITSVGTLGSLTVTGNATSGNLLTGGLISATGNITGGYLLGNGTFITGLSASKIFNGTSEANIGTSGGNANITIGGTSNVVVFSTVGISVAGTVQASGNITGGNLSGTSIVGTLTTAAQTNITSVGTLGALAVTGNITSGNLSGTSIVGTLTTAAQTNITSVGTLGSLSVTGNATSGNLLTGGLISATANITGGNLLTGGVITVNSDSAATAIVNGAGNAVGNIGSTSVYFNRIFAQATTALYADLAEMYTSNSNYPPGTVLVFGGNQEVTVSTTSHDSCVAGVVSTNPAHIMNSGLTAIHTVALGLAGRVPCKVVGPVTKGQQLVTSDIPGVAQALDPTRYQPGVVIGKAIENYNEPWPACGVIEVVVGRL